MNKKIVFGIVIVLILIGLFYLVMADTVNWANLNNMGYNIYNASNISASQFCVTSDCLHSISYNGSATIIK